MVGVKGCYPGGALTPKIEKWGHFSRKGCQRRIFVAKTCKLQKQNFNRLEDGHPLSQAVQ